MPGERGETIAAMCQLSSLACVFMSSKDDHDDNDAKMAHAGLVGTIISYTQAH